MGKDERCARMIPCHVIVDPLGVGKTTTVLNLLKARAGREKIAVIVNDFGRTGLDAELVGGESRAFEVKNVPGGCLCCTSAHAMGDALEAVLRSGEVERLVIEPSGLVVMPDFEPFLKKLCAEHALDLRPIITLLNPARVRAVHYETLPYFRSMIDAADVLVANRCDQCSDAQMAHFREWTVGLKPAKLRVLETSFGRLPEAVFGLSGRVDRDEGDRVSGHVHTEVSGGLAAELEPVQRDAFRGRLQGWLEGGSGGSHSAAFESDPADRSRVASV